jgi:tetratricopeptide (TPR) repeat protein
MVILFEIFIEENNNAFDDLMRILDEVTPLYKHRMDDLPSTLQEIVDTIALNWDGMLTKEIAKKIRLETKAVSAQLKQLQKYQIVETTSIGKNNIYIIKERFFNIWYLMRYGRKKDRNRVEWLVQFLLSWYSKSELKTKAERFQATLKDKDTLNDSYIFHMGEALSYTGMLEIGDEYILKNSVKEHLKGSSLYAEVTESDFELFQRANVLYKNKQVMEAIKLLESSKRDSHVIMAMLGLLYFNLKRYDSAEEYFLKALEKGNKKAKYGLASLYFKLAKKREFALKILKEDSQENEDYINLYVYAVILLWSGKFDSSYKKFIKCLKYDKVQENQYLITIYITLLIAKGQYYKTKEFLELSQYQLKERYKPLWYALMTLMQKEFPHEIKKMGSELSETVSEVLQKIEMMRKKYDLV